MELSLVQENGDALPTDSKAGFINNILHSVIKRQAIYLNDKSINSSTDHFNYKKYIETNATYNGACKKTILQSQGYYQDTPGNVSKLYVSTQLNINKRVF